MNNLELIATLQRHEMFSASMMIILVIICLLWWFDRAGKNNRLKELEEKFKIAKNSVGFFTEELATRNKEANAYRERITDLNRGIDIKNNTIEECQEKLHSFARERDDLVRKLDYAKRLVKKYRPKKKK